MYSSLLPGEAGRPGRMRLVAGGRLAGSHAPGVPAVLLCLSAATSRPTLVRTCSATTLDPCTSLARDCTSRPWAGTAIPVSIVPSSGPLSVKMSTSASAGWLSAFIRYSCRPATACCPGPTNQKSVPGPPQAAVGRPPPPVCSTSSAPAIDPVARTITPPRAGLTGILPPAAGLPPPGRRPDLALASGIFSRVSTPGWVRVISDRPAAALPAADSRLTTAVPAPAWPACPAAAVAAMSATWLPLMLPGNGHARIAAVTDARPGGASRRPDEAATGWLSQASPYWAASASTTSTPITSLFANNRLTSDHLRVLRRAPATGRRLPPRPAAASPGPARRGRAADPAGHRRTARTGSHRRQTARTTGHRRQTARTTGHRRSAGAPVPPAGAPVPPGWAAAGRPAAAGGTSGAVRAMVADRAVVRACGCPAPAARSAPAGPPARTPHARLAGTDAE